MIDFYEHHPDLAVQRPDLVQTVTLVDKPDKIAKLSARIEADHEKRAVKEEFKDAALAIVILLAFIGAIDLLRFFFG